MKSNEQDSDADQTSKEYVTEERMDFNVQENNLDRSKKEGKPDLYHVKLEYETEEITHFSEEPNEMHVLDNLVKQINPMLAVVNCIDCTINSDEQEMNRLEKIEMNHNTERCINFPLDKNKHKSGQNMNPILKQVKMEYNSEEINFTEMENKEYHHDKLENKMNQSLDLVKIELNTDVTMHYVGQESKSKETCSFNQMGLPSQKLKMVSNEIHFTPQEGSTYDQNRLTDQMHQVIEQPFRCSECNFQTNLKRKLSRHLQIKHSEVKKNRKINKKSNFVSTRNNNLTFNKYVYKTVSGTHLKKNLRNHSGNKNTESECQIKFNNFNKNPGSKSIVYKLNCTECDYKTNQKNMFLLHMSNHSGKYEPHSNEKHKRSSNFKLLTNKQSSDYKFHCTECEYKSNYKYNFQRHMKNHSADYKFHCTECKFKSNDAYKFQRHSKKHSTHYKFHCTECDYKNNDKYSFNRHINKHSADYKFRCTECEYKCKDKYNFQRHVNKHSADYKFRCTECEYKSNNNNNFQCHINKHSTDYKYHCTKCQYKSNHNSNFQRHINKHSADYTFHCTECKYKSKDKYNFQRHIQSHSTDYKFHCRECEHKSNDQYNFQRHINKHSAEYKFHCTKCEYKSKDKYNLQSHMKKHSADYQFRCTECEYKTNYISNLHLHMTKHGKECTEREYKVKKKSLNLKMKLEIVERLEKGEGAAAIGQIYGRTESTIRTIKANIDVIKRSVKQGTPLACRVSKYTKNPLIIKTKRLLYEWIKDNKHIAMGTNAIKSKAFEIYQHLKQEQGEGESASMDFTTSKRWFERMFHRFNLHYIKFTAASADKKADDAFRNMLKSFIEENSYSSQLVFNAGETGLFWKRMPSRTFISTEEKSASDYKAANDRLTLLFCGNANGDFKCKPLLIYHSANPRPLRHVSKYSLPVHWKSNKKLMMTVAMFDDWFTLCFCPEVERYCLAKKIEFKVLLLLDTATSHSQYLDSLNPNVKVMFMPPNTTSLLQPMNQGIIAAFKRHYLKHTFTEMFNAINGQEELKLHDFWCGYSIFSAIRNIKFAWDDMKDTTMNAAWRKLWPECVTTSSTLIHDYDIAELLTLGRQLPGEGFDDLQAADIEELVESHDTEMTAEEVNEMDKQNAQVALEDGGEEESLLDLLTVKNLAKIVEMTEELVNFLHSVDDNYERSMTIRRDIQALIAPYTLLLEEKKRAIQAANTPSLLQAAISTHCMTASSTEADPGTSDTALPNLSE